MAYDLADIFGQAPAKRALEIAAAGGHRFYIAAEPGSGANALTSCLSGLQPDAAGTECARVVDPALAQIEVKLETISLADLRGAPPETSADVRQRVLAARARQSVRQGGLNGGLKGRELMLVSQLNMLTQDMLQRMINPLRLTSRDIINILRIGRTIADLDNRLCVERIHISEALIHVPPHPDVRPSCKRCRSLADQLSRLEPPQARTLVVRRLSEAAFPRLPKQRVGKRLRG